MRLTKKDRTIVMEVEVTPNPKLIRDELMRLEKVVIRLKKMGIEIKTINK